MRRSPRMAASSATSSDRHSCKTLSPPFSWPLARMLRRRARTTSVLASGHLTSYGWHPSTLTVARRAWRTSRKKPGGPLSRDGGDAKTERYTVARHAERKVVRRSAGVRLESDVTYSAHERRSLLLIEAQGMLLSAAPAAAAHWQAARHPRTPHPLGRQGWLADSMAVAASRKRMQRPTAAEAFCC